jgi:hypothetical protein
MYRYIFDLRLRHQGLVVATRHQDRTVAVAGDEWSCVAANNSAALELARRAAFTEWPPVPGRVPNDFIVRFSGAAETEELETKQPLSKTGIHLKLGAASPAPGRARRAHSR